MNIGIMQIGLGVIAAAVLALTLKRESPVFSLLLAALMGIMLIIALLPRLKSIIDIIIDIGDVAGENGYTGILLKIIGITYVAQFASDICADAGEITLANKAVLAGKVLIAFYSMPIAASLIDQINIMLR